MHETMRCCAIYIFVFASLALPLIGCTTNNSTVHKQGMLAYAAISDNFKESQIHIMNCDGSEQ